MRLNAYFRPDTVSEPQLVILYENVDQNIRKAGDGQKPSLVFMRSQLSF